MSEQTLTDYRNQARRYIVPSIGARPVASVERRHVEAMIATAAPVQPAGVAAIRVAAMTGLRIGEVLAVRWQNLDFEAGRLTLPETKTGRRTHDLPNAALAVMDALPRIHGCPWTFTATGRAAITYRTVRAIFASVAKRAGMADVRLHDLRRTVMTRAAAMAGNSAEIVEINARL